MIQSMTGFGRIEVKTEARKITVETRSVNSKQGDIIFRMPSELRSIEMEMRKRILQALVRGKIDVAITIEELTAFSPITFDAALAKSYWQQLQDLSAETGLPLPEEPLRLVLSLQGVTGVTPSDSAKAETMHEEVLSALDETLQRHVDFRKQEGVAIYEAFKGNIQHIEELLHEVARYDDERIQSIKQRLQDSLADLRNVDYDHGRLEQEMIYYIEKLDVTEEKTRLANHLRYFIDTLDNETSQGRKLGFIAQEIGREINTLGSKSNHSEMQKIVVRMKDELEQIKEQVLNVL